MGNSQIHNNILLEKKQKLIYNEALYKTLLQKLKYIEQHNPLYHGDFNTYYSDLSDIFDKELLINHSEISIKYFK
jgi:hypothetical protein